MHFEDIEQTWMALGISSTSSSSSSSSLRGAAVWWRQDDVTDKVAGVIDACRYWDVILMQAFKQVRCPTTPNPPLSLH